MQMVGEVDVDGGSAARPREPVRVVGDLVGQCLDRNGQAFEGSVVVGEDLVERPIAVPLPEPLAGRDVSGTLATGAYLAVMSRSAQANLVKSLKECCTRQGVSR